MNGLLLDRHRSQPPAGAPPPDLEYGDARLRSYVFLRPHAREFAAWALGRFRVAVWSSASARNLSPLVNLVFGEALRPQLAIVWAQDKCSVDGAVAARDGKTKPRFLKELSRVFAKGLGRPERTLLLDDDAYKASRNPPRTALHPKPYTLEARHTDSALAVGGVLRTLLDRLADATSVPDFLAATPLPAGL